TLTGTSLGVGVGDLEVLTDATGNAVVASVLDVVESGGNTEVTLEDSGATLTAPVRLRALGPPSSKETAKAVPAPPAGYLSTAGTAAPYAKGDPVRLSQSTAATGLVPVGAAIIQRLETQLAIDEALPSDATGLSFTIVTAGPGGDTATVTPGTVINCPGAVP